MDRKPYIGAIVHYINQSGYHRPAIIVEVHDANAVDVQIFGDNMYDEPSIEFRTWVYPDSSVIPDHLHAWHWIEEKNG